MIYNTYNEVECDYNCKDCKVYNICVDRIENKEDSIKIVEDKKS